MVLRRMAVAVVVAGAERLGRRRFLKAGCMVLAALR